MALLDFEGFDDAVSPRPPWAFNGIFTTDIVRVTPGASGVSGSYSVDLAGNPTTYTLPSNLTSLVVGARVMLSGLQDGKRFLFLTDDSAGADQLSLVIKSTGAIELHRGNLPGTILGTSAIGLIQAGVNFYVEIKATISDSVGICVVRINGITVISVTNVDTKQSANAWVQSVSFVNADGTGGGFLDDFYLCDLTGSAPYNDFLGDCKVEQLYPSGAGTYTEFTPSSGANYTCVDEPGTPNDATDYVSSATSGVRDLYAATNLLSTAGTVLGVKPHFRAKKDDAGTRQMQTMVRSGITENLGPARSLSSAYAYYEGTILTADPNTSASWTLTAVNALEIGIKNI